MKKSQEAKLPKSSESELEITDISYWKDKVAQLDLFLKEQYEKNKNQLFSFKSKKSKDIDKKIFKYAPIEIRSNEDFMLEMVRKGYVGFYELPKELKHKKDFVLRYANELNNAYYFCIDDEMMLDEEIFILFLKKDEKTYTKLAYSYELTKKYGSAEKALEFLDINPKVYEHFPSKVKENLEVSRKAVDLDINNIGFMTKAISCKILKNRDECLEIINKKVDYFPMMSKKFRSDLDFMKEVLSRKPSYIELAADKIKHNSEIVEISVGAYNLLRHISEDSKRNEALMRKHLEHAPMNYVLLKDYVDINKIMTEIISRYHYTYEYLQEKDKENDDFIFAVLKHDGFFSFKNKEKSDFSYYGYTKKVSIFNILPIKIQDEIIQEFTSQEGLNKDEFMYFDEDEKQSLYLSYARNKYTNIYLKKHLVKNEETRKRFKV